MDTVDAEQEFRSIRAAFNTLRKMGYVYEGGSVWVPPPETLPELQILGKAGWYQVWQVRGGKKRSSDGYALVTKSFPPVLHFNLYGHVRQCPKPYGDQTIGYEKCKAPNFREVM